MGIRWVWLGLGLGLVLLFDPTLPHYCILSTLLIVVDVRSVCVRVCQWFLSGTMNGTEWLCLC